MLHDCIVANATFRFVIETELFIPPRKTSLNHVSKAKTSKSHSPGVIFQSKGEINHERHAGSFYDRAEV